MQVCDTLPGYGAIRSMVTGLIDDEVGLQSRADRRVMAVLELTSSTYTVACRARRSNGCRQDCRSYHLPRTSRHLTRALLLIPNLVNIRQRTLFPTSRRSLHLPASAAPPDPSLDETEGQTAFTATTGLWRLQLAPTPAGQAAEVWIASDKERTAVSFRRVRNPHRSVLTFPICSFTVPSPARRLQRLTCCSSSIWRKKEGLPSLRRP